MKPLTEFDKALVPLGVMAGLGVLGLIGITGEMTVEQALSLVVTAVLVYLKRNKK